VSHAPSAAGLGGLAFVALVVLQNLARGATAPPAGAPVAEILAHYASHRAVEQALLVTFVLGAAGLALFVGGALDRLARAGAGGLAQTFLLGAGGIVALFAAMVATEVALLAATARPGPDPAVVATLWTMHDGLFAILATMIAIATLALAVAGARTGLVPRAFRWLGPAAAALLTLGTIAGPQVAAGGARWATALSGIGFLGWLALVTAASLRLLRPARP
jgi:hypothetical protein